MVRCHAKFDNCKSSGLNVCGKQKMCSRSCLAAVGGGVDIQIIPLPGYVMFINQYECYQRSMGKQTCIHPDGRKLYRKIFRDY